MSLMQMKTPDEVIADDEAAKAERSANGQPKEAVIGFLANHVRHCWEEAKTGRQMLTNRLLDCHRRRRGKYSAEKLAKIKSGHGSDIFMNITGAKCRAAKAWISDLYGSDRVFSLDPTPIADLPPNIQQEMMQVAMQAAMQEGVPVQQIKMLLEKHRDRLMDDLQKEAETRAERMSDKIDDALVEGSWHQEFADYIDDLCTYPFAVMKGLEFSRKKVLTWEQQGGRFVPINGSKIIPVYRRVSPFRFYASSAARHTLKGHWAIEHHTFSRQNLSDMRASPGYDPEAIANVLLDYGTGGLRQWVWSESELAQLNEVNAHWISSKDQIDGLEWSGTLSGQTLLDEGMDPSQIPDPHEEYPVSIITVGPYVIRAMISADPLGEPDYMVSSWESVPGSLIGIALPEKLSDCQDMCNATARALVDNMGMSAGPMVGIWSDQIDPATDITKMHPRKIFYFEKHQPGQGSPIEFFQPQSNSQELLAIYERFNRYADDITGLPSYAYGSDQAAGAGKTASGLSMLMNAASKNIKDVIRDTDMNIIEPATTKVFNYLMLADPDQSIKGDSIVKARGSMELVHKEQAQLRQQELLGMTNNPTDMTIMGLGGRTELLRNVMETGDMNVDRVLPTKEQVLERQQQQLAPPQEQEPANA